MRYVPPTRHPATLIEAQVGVLMTGCATLLALSYRMRDRNAIARSVQLGMLLEAFHPNAECAVPQEWLDRP